MNLSKEFILQNENMTLKEAFSNLFETKLEVGRWYKVFNKKAFAENFIYIQRNIKISEYDKEIRYYGYGFDSNKKWFDEMIFVDADYLSITPATDSEVEAALINEAKKRGFKEGNYFDLSDLGFENNDLICSDNMYWDGIYLNIGRHKTGIFKSGVWGKVV